MDGVTNLKHFYCVSHLQIDNLERGISVADYDISANDFRIGGDLEDWTSRWLKTGELIFTFLFFSFVKAVQPTHYREYSILFLLCVQKAINDVCLLLSRHSRSLDTT